MLRLNKVNIYLNKNNKLLIENFNFSLQEGDKVAVIGEEGDGKSTLLKLMADERLISDYADYEGSVVRCGKVAYMPQFLPKEYNEMTVSEYIREAAPDDGYLINKADGDYEFLYDRSFSDRKMGSLSGGEKIKIQLYKLLIGRPDVLLLDEPSNDLDSESVGLLTEIIQNTSAAVVFISHDETLIESAANVIIHIEQINRKQNSRVTVSRLDYTDYVNLLDRLFERNMRIAVKERAEYKKKTERLRKLMEKAKNNDSWQNEDGIPSSDGRAKRNMQSIAAKARRLEKESMDFTEIPKREWCILTKFDENIVLPRSKKIVDIEISPLTAGDKFLSKKVQLTVFGNEHICITGKNGAGKSTLLKEIYNRLNDRRDIVLGYMPQNYGDVLDFSVTPLKFLQENFDKELMTKAMSYMGSMNFTRDEMNSPIGCLSGGSQAKLIFLRMVLCGANVLLLDEPTRNFSPLSAPVIRKALVEFGGAFVSVSHDAKFIEETAGTVYVLSESGLSLL